MMDRSHRCYIPSFVEIDPDAANKLSFPIPKEAPYNLALIGSAVLEKKMFEHCERRTDAGPDEYPISSPMSLPGSVCCFLEQETFTPQKYW